MGRTGGEEIVIGPADNISIHPVTPIRGRSPKTSGFSIAAAGRACRTYFDWHPVVGGLALMAVGAVAISAAFVLLESGIPVVGGWAICTPLNGAVLAILLMSRRKLWPFLLLGYLLALSRGVTLMGAMHHPGPIEIFGNLAELLIAAFTLPPYRNFKQWLQEPRLLPAFAGYALLLGPAVMALTSARNLPGGFYSVQDLHASFWDRVRIIGFAESLGVALGTTLVLVLCNQETYRLFRLRSLTTSLGLFGLLGLSTWFAFSHPAYPAIFLPSAVLVLIALRLGVRGAMLGAAISSVLVCGLTSRTQQIGVPATWPQSYLALSILAALPLGVTVFKRSELEQRVRDYQSELDKLKSLDRLTGIANRKRFDLVLTREWQRGTRDPKPIALLMIDTDFFDLYNEHYGTHAGDECLRRIAARLADQPHRQYDLVSRFEGGRFSVLLPGASGDAVKRIGEVIRSEIAAFDWQHERSQFGRVTVSIGWASMTPNGDLKPDLLIAAADAALETAKRKGRNRVEGFSSNLVEMTPFR